MKNSFETAFDRIVEVVMFENWLRFYFIAEKGDKLIISLPEKAVERIEKDYPTLFGLAEMLDGREIDHQSSVEAVCMFVAGRVETATPEHTIKEVFDSARFHMELNLFGMWVQNHEDQLDEAFIPFARWQQLYGEWRNTPKVQEHIASFEEQAARIAGNATETSQ